MKQRNHFLVLVALVLMLAMPFSLLAQEGTGGTEGETEGQETEQETVQTAQTTQQQGTGGVPANATPIAVLFLDHFNEYTLDFNQVITSDLNVLGQTAQQAQLQNCGQVRVYKVSPDAIQDLWPHVACSGNQLTLQAGGTGHYIVYEFSSDQSAVNAPLSLPLCASDQSCFWSFLNLLDRPITAG